LAYKQCSFLCDKALWPPLKLCDVSIPVQLSSNMLIFQNALLACFENKQVIPCLARNGIWSRNKLEFYQWIKLDLVSVSLLIILYAPREDIVSKVMASSTKVLLLGQVLNLTVKGFCLLILQVGSSMLGFRVISVVWKPSKLLKILNELQGITALSSSSIILIMALHLLPNLFENIWKIKDKLHSIQELVVTIRMARLKEESVLSWPWVKPCYYTLRIDCKNKNKTKSGY